MGNQSHGGDKLEKPGGKDLMICQSLSQLSYSNSIETDLNIDEFLNEQKDATAIDNLQRLWERDSALWTTSFNNKRDKFLKVIKLTKSLEIKNIKNYENEKEMIFQILAELNLNQEILNKEIFQFQLSKSYKADVEIDQIENVKEIDWILNIEWKDENAYIAINDALKSKEAKKQNGDNLGTQEILNEFTSFILQWLSSNNIEQFRIKTVDKKKQRNSFAE